jgi:hypothetical protein
MTFFAKGKAVDQFSINARDFLHFLKRTTLMAHYCTINVFLF